MALDEELDSVSKEAEFTAVCEKVSDGKRKKVGHFRICRNSGLSRIDSLFSCLYLNSCEKSGRGIKFLEKLAVPLSKISSTAICKKYKKRIGIFSDSSTEIVGNIVKFLKKRPLETISCVLAIVFAFLVYSHNAQTAVYEVYIDGVSVGSVDDISVLNSAKSRAEKHITDITGLSYNLPCTISYTLSDSRSSTLDEENLYKMFTTYTSDEICYGWGLYVDGEEIAVLTDREDITSVFLELEQKYYEKTGNDASIANTVNICYDEFDADSIIFREDLMTLLISSETSVENDTPSTLLASDTVSTYTLPAAETPDTPANEDGQKKNVSSVVISYEVVTFETVRETLPYETHYIEDSSLFKGQTKVSKYGYNGQANVTYAVSSIDDEEISKEVVSVSTVYEPITEIVKVGTRDLPEKMSEDVTDGKYMILPVADAYISDRYGSRILNGKSDYHYGLDLAANAGTQIYAAASGTVIYAQYNSSFGNCIKIQHPDGVISLYAHCSSLSVEVGEVVEQGQPIAKVGNTGYSFGNHCHMEVIVNGERVNPELYIYTE